MPITYLSSKVTETKRKLQKKVLSFENNNGKKEVEDKASTKEENVGEA